MATKTLITKASPPPTFEEIQAEKDIRKMFRLIKRHDWQKFLFNKTVYMVLYDIQVDGVLHLESFSVGVSFGGQESFNLLIEFDTNRSHCKIWVLPPAVRNYTVERAKEYVENLKLNSLSDHGKFEVFPCGGFVSRQSGELKTLEMV